MRSFFSAIGRIISILFLVSLLLACIGPFIASQIYLERAGVTTTGTVVRKIERVENQANSNNWVRRQTLMVTFVPLDDPTPITTSILVNQAAYDAYDVGASVDVRYAPYKNLRLYGTFGTKLAEQPPFASVMALTDDASWITILLIGVGIFAVWIIVHTKSVTLRITFSAMLLTVIGLGIIMSVRPAALFEPGTHQIATARVLEVKRIEIEPGTSDSPSEELIRPIDRVRLEFTPQGKASSVVAVDDIDADSIRGIAEGQEREVSYPTSNPRSAHLVGASYHHRLLNWLIIPRTALFIVVGFTLLYVVERFFDRVLRRRRTQTT